MISEPYICIKGWNAGSIYWLAKHPDGKLFGLSPRHNSCDLRIYESHEWKPYADFEREKAQELVAKDLRMRFMEWDREVWTMHRKNSTIPCYCSWELIEYGRDAYEADSESNRLVKRAEFLKAVCQKEGISWAEEKGECFRIQVDDGPVTCNRLDCPSCKKGECVEVEEYETEDGIGLRFPKGIEAKTFLAKVKKANQGGCVCENKFLCLPEDNCPCKVCHKDGDYWQEKPQKPSEEERWNALLDMMDGSTGILASDIMRFRKKFL